MIHEDKSNVKRNAYTLIELLVVIVIMAIIFSITIGNFRDYQARRTLDNAANQVRSDLRLAQERAKAGQKPDPSTYTCGALIGHALIAAGGTSSYYLSPVCSGPTTCTDAELTGTCTDRNLNEDIIISNNNIRFNVLGRGALLEQDPFAASTTITLTHENGDTRTITVVNGGNIE